jgi:hypothetical protein
MKEKFSKTRWSYITPISPVTKVIPDKKKKIMFKEILKEEMKRGNV